MSARLQDPLLDGALHFFALVAQEEAILPADAVAAVRELLCDFLPAQTAARLADFFAVLLPVPQTPDGVCAPLRAEFNYADRFYILLKTLEFRRLAARGKEPVPLSEGLPRLLDVREADARVLAALDEGRDDDAAAISEATARVLPVADTERAGALWLPAGGVRATFLAVEGQYYVACHGDQLLRVARQTIPKNVFVRVRRDETVAVGGKRVTVPDLQYYFRQAARPPQPDRLYVRVDPRATIISRESPSTADLCLTLEGVAPVVEFADPAHAGVAPLDGQAAEWRVPVWLGDEVCCHRRRLPVRKLIAYARRDHFTFTDSTPICTVSNDPCAAIHVQDEAGQPWTAWLERTGGGVHLRTGDCPHPFEVGGRSVGTGGGTAVRSGEVVRVAGASLRIDPAADGALTVTARDERFATVSVEGVAHRFADGSVALDDLSFELQRGDLVCVLGPSGCGKSTLLNVLNGTLRPTRGDVRLDGVSLFDHPAWQRHIGFVPQDDLLQENLTVRENLSFAARLRRPGESTAGRAALVKSALGEIDLREKQHARIGNVLDKVLSGGQRKRVNVGLELVGPGSLLLLDEPTSGLSAGDTHKIVEVLRARADAGNIVFAVLHQPSARVLADFDKVLVLDQGGRLAFYGGVEGCYRFFAETLPGAADAANPVEGFHDPEIIFEALEQAKVRLDGSPGPERRYPPGYWQARYRAVESRYHPAPLREDAPLPPPAPPVRQASFLSLSGVLLKRECLNKRRGRGGLFLALASAFCLGAAAAFACRVEIGGHYSYRGNEALPNYMFLTVIVCLFLAVSGSVQEIIRDRAILLRERTLSIPFLAYLQSKFVALFLVYACQLTLYLAVGFWVLQIPELFWSWWAFLAVVGCAGIGLGLALSAIPQLSERAAAVLVPLVIIPQIILCGADPFPFTRMGHLQFPRGSGNDGPPALAQLVPSRWAFEGLVALHRDRGFARRYEEALGTLGAADRKFFRQHFTADFVALKRSDPAAYAQRLTQFSREYEAAFSRPLVPERLALYYVKQSGEASEPQPDPDVHPMQERMADAFNRDGVVQNRFAHAHRVPVVGWWVNAAWFDAGVLGLFAAGFLALAALAQSSLPRPFAARRPPTKKLQEERVRSSMEEDL